MKKPWLTPEGTKVWKDSKGEPSESQYWSWRRGAVELIVGATVEAAFGLFVRLVI